MAQDEFDVLIVGSGSAGGSLAARLTERAERNVLVLEAGSVYDSVESLPQSVKDPGDISNALPGSPQNWRLFGEPADGFNVPITRGKVMGGSSSINGAYFIRATRENFDEWVALGNDEWSYEKVLPFYKRTESEKDFGDDTTHHATDGPIPVQREPLDRAPEFTTAFTDGAMGLGFPLEEDKNATGIGGVGPVPANISRGIRVGTAVGYLIPALSRPNLSIKGGAHVTRLLFDGPRCIGVEALVDGQHQRFYANETVLSAGALRSPQLLMLSGLGPGDHLREHGIEVLVDLPGVGQNLMDHPEISSPWTFRGKHRTMPTRSAMTNSINWTAEGSSQTGDLEILPFVATPSAMMHLEASVLKHPAATLSMMRQTSPRLVMQQTRARRVPFVLISVMQADSRGQVTLTSADPLANPGLKWNFFREESDRRRFREGMKVLYELWHSPQMQAIGAKLLALGKDDLASDRAMDVWMTTHIFTPGHPSCTCKMGPDSDPTAVVDQYGRVRGVENLRVVDQSIFPKIPSRGPNATTIMLGDRMSEFFA